jgi:hypothetical protein
MKIVGLATAAVCGLTLLSVLALLPAAHPACARSASSTRSFIDGTFELTERVMANGRVLRPPAVVALYTSADGRFSLDLFVRQDDGSIASESTVGSYRFSADKYCEWVIYTVRKDLDKPGVTNEAPAVTDHCTAVQLKNGRFEFSPPGEGVEVSYGREGFTAKIGDEFVDHWVRIR